MHGVTRIWKGPEMEGPETGVLTYFVESSTLNDETVEFLRNFILSNSDCKRIYLGANTTDVVEFGNLFFKDRLPCDRIVMEIEGNTLASHSELLNAGDVIDNLIVRQTIKLDSENEQTKSFGTNISTKIDVPGKWCRTWSVPDSTVDTSIVSNGLYDGVDVEVYRR